MPQLSAKLHTPRSQINPSYQCRKWVKVVKWCWKSEMVLGVWKPIICGQPHIVLFIILILTWKSISEQWLMSFTHHAPEGTLGRKKRPRQVSYLFGKVLMSTFRKVWFRNIWPSSFWLNCIFVLFWWIFTQPYFSLHTMVLFCGFGAIFWVLLGWGMSMGQFWYSTLFAFLHFFCNFCPFFCIVLVLVDIWIFWEYWWVMR